MTVPPIASATPSATEPDADQRILRSTSWPRPSRSSRSLRVADLFCGAGGMSLGAFLAATALKKRFEVALAVEANANAAAIYRHNFRDFLAREDALRSDPIESFLDGDLDHPGLTAPEEALRGACSDGGPIDLLMGGPPCQGHSDLNNHTRRTDSRNDLYGRMARAARALEPTVLIIENVRQVIHDNGGVVGRTEAALAEDYELEHHVLRFEHLGVPQRRHRHALVGVRKGRDSERRLAALRALLDDSKYGQRGVDWAIGDLDGLCPGEGRGFDNSSVSSADNLKRLEWFDRNRHHRNLPNEQRPPCHKEGGHSYLSVYGRLDPKAPANTVTTGYGSMGQGRYVHPHDPRTITPHEAARLQTFPDYFRFDVEGIGRSAWAKAIGNAVPPFGIREVIRALFSIS